MKFFCLANVTAVVIRIPHPIARIPHPITPVEIRVFRILVAATWIASPIGDTRVMSPIKKHPIILPIKIIASVPTSSLLMNPAVPVKSLSLYPTIARSPRANRIEPKSEPNDWIPAVRYPKPAVPIYIPYIKF